MEKIKVNNEIVEYDSSNKENSFIITIQEESTEFKIFKYGNEYLLLNTEENTFKVLDTFQTKEKTIIWIDDEEIVLMEESEGGVESGEGVIENVIKAPMPGIVKEIKFKEKESVKKGDTVIVLESMKVLHELKALTDGVIKKILVQPDSQVEPSEILVEIEPQEEK